MLLAIEFAGPFIGERKDWGTPWHAHHIAERHSLLAIITLGEGVVGPVATLSAVVQEQVGLWMWHWSALPGTGVEEMSCLVQMRPVLDWVVCKLSAPGEAEGGSAGTQPSQGIIRRAHRADRAER